MLGDLGSDETSPALPEDFSFIPAIFDIVTSNKLTSVTNGIV